MGANRKFQAQAGRKRDREALPASISSPWMPPSLGWWHYNPITKMACWDDGYKAIFGVTGYERPNDEILTQIIHPEDLPGLWAKVEATLNPTDLKPFATGQMFDMEFPLRGADSIFRPFLTRVLPLKDAKGQVLQWFGTNTDVTEGKRIEEALGKTNHVVRLPKLSRPNGNGFLMCWRLCRQWYAC